MAELAGIVDRHTESYSALVCGVIARGQRTTYTVNPHGVPDWAGMIPGPVGFAADLANACVLSIASEQNGHREVSRLLTCSAHGF